MAMQDERFAKFIKTAEKKFKAMNIESEKDFDNLDEKSESKIETMMNQYEKIFNIVWNEVGNKFTVDKIWKNHYEKSKYNYIFRIF